MRKSLVGVVLSLGVLLWSQVAHAHDPIILTSEQRTPAEGPLLPDGTVSFALYGTLDAPGDTRGFRVSFAEGDPLYLSILIPDLEPENTLDDDSLPYLVVTDPSGSISELPMDERVAFAEPFSGTNYVRLAQQNAVAEGGTYDVLVTGGAAARFTVSVGTKEMFGTEVENVPNRELGVGGVMAWYSTPPSTMVTTSSSAAPDTVVPVTPVDEPVAVMAEPVETDVDNSGGSIAAESDDDPEQGANAAPVLIALGVIVVVGVVTPVVVLRRRRN